MRPSCWSVLCAIALASPAVAEPRSRGSAATFKLVPVSGEGAVKVRITVGVDQWKAPKPDDISTSHVSLHRGSEPDAEALISTIRCENPEPDACVNYGLEDRLKVYASAPEAQTTPRGPNRVLGTTSWTKEMRDKRAHTTKAITWYAGGISELDPASSLVVTCGTAATPDEAHFKQVLALCETMKIVR